MQSCSLVTMPHDQVEPLLMLLRGMLPEADASDKGSCRVKRSSPALLNPRAGWRAAAPCLIPLSRLATVVHTQGGSLADADADPDRMMMKRYGCAVPMKVRRILPLA